MKLAKETRENLLETLSNERKDLHRKIQVLLGMGDIASKVLTYGEYMHAIENGIYVEEERFTSINRLVTYLDKEKMLVIIE